MYPNVLVIPMREDLTKLGVRELRTPKEVDEVITNREGKLCSLKKLLYRRSKILEPINFAAFLLYLGFPGGSLP